MNKIKFILGFSIYCLFGAGAEKPLWTAMSLYTHKYLYAANKPYSYKRAKELWGKDQI